MTPGEAIRELCVDCVGSTHAGKNCQGDQLHDRPCLLFRYRMGKGRPSVRLIRKYCLWCMGGSWKLVENCPSKACPLLPYRMGKNPAMAGRKFPSVKQLDHALSFCQERSKTVTRSDMHPSGSSLQFKRMDKLEKRIANGLIV